MGEVAALGVGAVALGADPFGPVVSRRRGRVDRYPAAERVGPRRLVEMAVDDKATATHDEAASSARSRSVVTTWVTVTVHVASGASDRGHDSRSPAPW